MFEELLKKLASLPGDALDEIKRLILEALGVLHNRTEELKGIALRAADRSEQAVLAMADAQKQYDEKHAELAQLLEDVRQGFESGPDGLTVAARGGRALPANSQPLNENYQRISKDV